MSGGRALCRSCGGENLLPILSLGKTPLANALLLKAQLNLPEPAFPLDLVFCSRCALVQITESVSPEMLFREYLYFSSFSDTVVQHARELAGKLIEDRALGRDSLVVEVASNDGYLLQHYHQAGIPVLGIEPAVNIAQVANDRGIQTFCEFFDDTLARQLVKDGHRADVIHAHNVLAHVPALNAFVTGIATLLEERGVAIIEVPYVVDLIDHVEFDTIYHEHLSYFSLMALQSLFTRHGLQVVDVERIGIHGGSLRLFLSHRSVGHDPESLPARRVTALLAAEASWGVDQVSRYRQFGETVEGLRADLVALLREIKTKGHRIVAYGASAKGCTLLNYCGIGNETLDFVVDRSTVKQGRYTPGTHLLIESPERLLEALPEYVLLLTWNFAEEILAQQAEYRRQGGYFIIPIPRLEVVR